MQPSTTSPNSFVVLKQLKLMLPILKFLIQYWILLTFHNQ